MLLNSDIYALRVVVDRTKEEIDISIDQYDPKCHTILRGYSFSKYDFEVIVCDQSGQLCWPKETA